MEFDLKDKENDGENTSQVQRNGYNETVMQSILNDMRRRSSEDLRRRSFEASSPYHSRRRLSECVEEDEDVTDEQKSSVNTESIKKQPSLVTVVGKFMVTRALLSDARNLHVDRNFFDESLVEMRISTKSPTNNNIEVKEQIPPQSEVDSKIWVKRSDSSLISSDTVSYAAPPCGMIGSFI